LKHERIRTTPAKAKEARRLAEKVITLAKEGSLASRRRALALLGGDREIVKKLFEEIAPRFEGRNGGYTRILHLDEHRLGDNAPQVIFELVGEEERVKAKPVKPTKKEAAPEEAQKEEKPAEPEAKAENKPAEQEDAAPGDSGEQNAEQKE